MGGTLEESSQDGREWLGSPLFISHQKAMWNANNPIWGTYDHHDY